MLEEDDGLLQQTSPLPLGQGSAVTLYSSETGTAPWLLYETFLYTVVHDWEDLAVLDPFFYAATCSGDSVHTFGESPLSNVFDNT